MTGGIIQLSTYGSQDLYLTGTPEITFFKVVYRRYTNFAIDSVMLNFDTNVGFDKECSITLPRIGDLISKMYIQIKLPSINLLRNHTPDEINYTNYENALNDYYGVGSGIGTIISFLQLNRQAYNIAYDDYLSDNIVDPTKTIQNIHTLFLNNSFIVGNFKALMDDPPDYYGFLPYKYEEVSMDYIAETYTGPPTINELFKVLSIGISKTIRLQNFFFTNLSYLKGVYEDDINNNLKFAWVKKVGHAIIDYVELYIGGNKIDKHYGDWINIWHELSADVNKENTYNEMIGNVSILTDFNRMSKPTYTLSIPLQFWFCKHSGLALPIVAMQYHDVTVNVKLRNIQDVSYIENNENIFYNNSYLNLYQIPDEMGINLSANLLVDYIYLDTLERRRFAQSRHEYLIEQLQVLEQKNINQQSYQFVLDNFVYPSKELIWVVQKNSYTDNYNGYIETQFDNYTASDNKQLSLSDSFILTFNGYTRIEKNIPSYFNYLQPFESHKKTPDNGINNYSFSIFPEERQPSGSANLSRLSKIILSVEFNKNLVTNGKLFEPVNMRVYSRSLNILRFINGFAIPAYTFG